MHESLLTLSVFLLTAGIYAEWADWRVSSGLFAAAIALLLIARMGQAREQHDELIAALEDIEPMPAPRPTPQSSLSSKSR